MADDVTLPGSGAVIATDDIGSGRQVQLVKPAFGADGSATMVSADNPLPAYEPIVFVTANATATGVAIASTDLTGYQSVILILSGTWSGTVQLQLSPDNSSWTTVSPAQLNLSLFNALPSNAGTSSSLTGAGAYIVQLSTLHYRYARANVSSYSSGTISLTLRGNRNISPLVPVHIGSSSNLSVAPGTSNTSNDALSNSHWTSFAAYSYGFNGTSWNRARFASIFKSVTATSSGDTAVWTPTSGKRFQLTAFKLFLTANAAQTTGGIITVTLRDNATSTGLAIPVFVPTTGGTGLGGWDSGWIDLGPYGFRSAAINQVLNVNLSAALTAGSIGVIAVGTEE